MYIWYVYIYMLLWLITPNVSWWHPPNFHDQLISPRPSAADRSLALRRWVKSSPPLMHSMISAYVTIVESLFLGGIYRYINKQIHTYIYIILYINIVNLTHAILEKLDNQMIPQGGLTPSQDSLSFKEIVAAVQGRSLLGKVIIILFKI